MTTSPASPASAPSAASVSLPQMQVLVARAGLVLNPGQMADLVLVWRQLAGLIASIPRDRPFLDDQAFVFRLPPPETAAPAPSKAAKPKPAAKSAVAAPKAAGKPKAAARLKAAAKPKAAARRAAGAKPRPAPAPGRKTPRPKR